ncbi:hypothetical protein DFJ74DRAFT_659322 [Hyaloraphidium curvatum]|nr:hypothetical protein DFJ74DRAFT_659322 [Hyaloraphidium curvatum]
MPSLPPPTDALVPFDFPTTGRGLRATRHLQAGIPVLRIPFADLYTIRSAEALFPGARALPELAAVTAFLAHHRFLGSGSPLAGYIASLPTDFSGWPAMLPQRAVDALPIELRKRVMDQRRLMETHFKAVLNSLEFGSSFGAFIRKDFARSWLLVNSRCVSVDFRDGGPRATLALAPFFDLFNHDPTVSSQIACNPATRTLDVVLDRDVPEGEQCFIFYGPHDDESLLLEYGFTLPNNPYEGVSLDGEFAGCGPEREQGPLRELCIG